MATVTSPADGARVSASSRWWPRRATRPAWRGSAFEYRTPAYHPTSATRLNVTSATGLRLMSNYVIGDVWLDATMTRSGNSVTVAIGAATTGAGNVVTATGTPEMQWYTSNAAADLAGNGGTANTVTELGNDRDL